MILLLLGCADDACVAMCDAGLERFEACLEEDGQQWGESVGYADAADYRDWCETYTWELQTLGEADTCASRRDALVSGTCDDYGAAWD